MSPSPNPPCRAGGRARAWARAATAGFTIVALLAGATAASAQSSTPPVPPVAGAIHGLVVDADTGAPLADVLVSMSDPPRRTTTDADGHFSFAALVAGRRTLVVSLVGYTLARPDVAVAPGSVTELTVPLSPGAGVYTERLTVRGDDVTTRAVAPVDFRMRSADLQELRGVLADDPFRAIQAMPGVATGDDFRAEFSVRGSDFRQMGFSVDGVPAPWLVHGPRAVNDTGTVAMMNADVLAEIGLTSGASPQPLGNRTGAWVQSTMREGSRDGLRLTGSLSGTGVSTVVEGPLGRRRKGAWLASVRKSYIDWLIARLAVQDDSAFGFSDAQSTVVYDVSPTQQLRLSAVAGRSRYREKDQTPSANGLAVAGAATGFAVAAWRSTLGPSTVVTQRLSWSGLRYRNRGDFDQDLANGGEWTAGYRADVTVVPAARLAADAGVSADREAASFERRSYSGTGLTAPAVRTVARWTHDRWRAGGYARARLAIWPSVSLDTGARLDSESREGRASASPWLLARWTRSWRWSLAAGASLAWQLADLSMLPPPGVSPTPGLERARSADLSGEFALSATVRVRASLYDRAETSTLRLDTPLPRLVNGQVRTPAATNLWLNALDVDAHGVELTVRRAASHGVVGWVSYGYGTTRNTDRVSGRRYWGDFDQRHHVNAYASYRLGARTNMGAKLRVGSNMPLPAYLTGTFDALRPSAVRNDARLPVYARLDLRASRTFPWSARRITLFAEVLNALGRQNLGRTGGTIRASGVVTGFTDALFPRLPSAGIRLEF